MMNMRIAKKAWRWFKARMSVAFWVLVILSLMAADYFAIYSVFIDGGSDDINSIVFGGLFALILEGVPTIMGSCLATLKDTTAYKNNKTKLIWLFSAGGIILAIAFVLVFAIRYFSIVSHGQLIDGVFVSGFTKQAFEQVDGTFRYGFYSGFYVDLFLMVSPILTSVFAFLISWMYLTKGESDDLEDDTDELCEKYTSALGIYRDVDAKFINAKNELWTELNTDDNATMPDTMAGYKRECYKKIRRKLNYDTMYCFRNYIHSITEEINSLLAQYIIELGSSDRTTMDADITNLKIKDIINDFNKDQKAKWGASEDEIKDILDEFKQIVENHVTNVITVERT